MENNVLDLTPWIPSVSVRAMEFIEALLQLLFEDRTITMSAAASQAYTETLYNFHTWYTSAAFQLALKVWLHYSPCYNLWPTLRQRKISCTKMPPLESLSWDTDCSKHLPQIEDCTVFCICCELEAKIREASHKHVSTYNTVRPVSGKFHCSLFLRDSHSSRSWT